MYSWVQWDSYFLKLKLKKTKKNDSTPEKKCYKNQDIMAKYFVSFKNYCYLGGPLAFSIKKFMY